MWSFIASVASIAFFVFVILLIISAIKKKPKKKQAIGLAASFVVFLAATGLTPPSSNSKDIPMDSSLPSSISSKASSATHYSSKAPNSSSKVVPSSSSKTESSMSTSAPNTTSPPSDLTVSSLPVASAPASGVAPKPQPPSQVVSAKPQSEMVWVVTNGKSYHSSSACSNMKNPKQITIEEAQASGRKPCTKCW